MARKMANHWFVSFMPPKQVRPPNNIARRTKTFATEAEAKQFAKEMLSDDDATERKIIAGTLLGAHQATRRIISGRDLIRWIAEG
jgi:hypothetical protein